VLPVAVEACTEAEREYAERANRCMHHKCREGACAGAATRRLRTRARRSSTRSASDSSTAYCLLPPTPLPYYRLPPTPTTFRFVYRRDAVPDTHATVRLHIAHIGTMADGRRLSDYLAEYVAKSEVRGPIDLDEALARSLGLRMSPQQRKLAGAFLLSTEMSRWRWLSGTCAATSGCARAGQSRSGKTRGRRSCSTTCARARTRWSSVIWSTRTRGW